MEKDIIAQIKKLNMKDMTYLLTDNFLGEGRRY